VLILEDEPLIRQLLQHHLQAMGAEVTCTAEGSETVRAYAAALTAGSRFDLVIMDLSIPGGMGGAQAMERIRAMDPEVTAIVSSGYSDDPVMSRHTDYGFRAVLPKPWQSQDLREVVYDLFPEHSR
jgi:CheY-like chemotaxis protein